MDGLETSTKTSYKAIKITPAQTLSILRSMMENVLHFTFVFVVAATALRSSELSLRWADILWEERKIRVVKSWKKTGADGDTKTRSSKRDVPMGRVLAHYLREWHKQTPYARPTDFVFPSVQRRGRIPIWLSVVWRLGDMRTLDFEEEFDAALCFGNSFGYLSRSDTKRFLKRLSTALRDGARFVLESGAIAESILPNLVRSRWMQVGDILFLSSIDYDAPTSRLISRYVFIRGAEREEKTAEVIVYTVGEVAELFGEAGFIVEGLFASPAKEPFHVGAPRLLLVARKTAVSTI